jgi:hypothetical protein
VFFSEKSSIFESTVRPISPARFLMENIQEGESLELSDSENKLHEHRHDTKGDSDTAFVEDCKIPAHAGHLRQSGPLNGGNFDLEAIQSAFTRQENLEKGVHPAFPERSLKFDSDGLSERAFRRSSDAFAEADSDRSALCKDATALEAAAGSRGLFEELCSEHQGISEEHLPEDIGSDGAFRSAETRESSALEGDSDFDQHDLYGAKIGSWGRSCVGLGNLEDDTGDTLGDPQFFDVMKH